MAFPELTRGSVCGEEFGYRGRNLPQTTLQTSLGQLDGNCGPQQNYRISLQLSFLPSLSPALYRPLSFLPPSLSLCSYVCAAN